MKCPKCDSRLQAHIQNHKGDVDYVEVEFWCEGNKEHIYFVRIRQDNLIEC